MVFMWTPPPPGHDGLHKMTAMADWPVACTSCSVVKGFVSGSSVLAYTARLSFPERPPTSLSPRRRSPPRKNLPRFYPAPGRYCASSPPMSTRSPPRRWCSGTQSSRTIPCTSRVQISFYTSDLPGTDTWHRSWPWSAEIVPFEVVAELWKRR